MEKKAKIGIDKARSAKQKALQLYGDLACVNGIGISRVGDDYAVKINLVREPDEADRIKTKIAGVPVIVSVIGRIRKQTTRSVKGATRTRGKK